MIDDSKSLISLRDPVLISTVTAKEV